MRLSAFLLFILSALAVCADEPVRGGFVVANRLWLLATVWLPMNVPTELPPLFVAPLL